MPKRQSPIDLKIVGHYIKTADAYSTTNFMARTLRVGMVGYRFMGKAHSNAWRQAPKFFPLKAHVEMHTICGRDPAAVQAARSQLGWQNSSTDWRELIDNPLIDIIDMPTANMWCTHRANPITPVITVAIAT